MSCYQNEVWLTETEKRICDLVKSMGINRMPTRSEVLLFSGDNSLENRIIPACVMAGKSQLSVGKNSIYDKYHCRWDLIKKFDYLMSEMIKGF